MKRTNLAIAALSLFATSLSFASTVEVESNATAQPAVVDSLGAALVKNATEAYPATIQMAVTGGMTVEKQFEAAGGLDGWVLSQGIGNNMVVYTSKDGAVAIAGNMLDASGKNLTKEYMEKYAPVVDYGPAWEQLEKSSWVGEGPSTAKNFIYVFKDANCSYCHLSWKALHPYTKAGLQVRWIPVAFLAADSYDKAAVLLASKSSKGIETLHANFGQRGGTKAPPATAEYRVKIEANNKLMNSLGFQGTPATLYKTEGVVKAINGMFPMAQLTEITGMPLIENKDPALERFQ